MNTPLSPEQLQEVRKEIHAGRIVSAVALYRQFSGLGLKESKEAAKAMIMKW